MQVHQMLKGKDRSQNFLTKEVYIDYILLELERSKSTKNTALIEQEISYILHMNIPITEKYTSLLL